MNSCKIFSLFFFLVSTSTLSAVNPNNLIGKPFSFVHLYTNNWGLHDDIKLDCFYNYSSELPISKQTKKNNRYYISGNYTLPDSLYNHIFIGIDFIDNPKKGSFFIMKDDKGDSLFMKLPKYNPDKEFLSYEKLYSHKNLKTTGKYSDKSTNVDLTVFDLSEWQSHLDTLSSTQNPIFHKEGLTIPFYRIINYKIQDNGEPLTDIVLNSIDTLYNQNISYIRNASDRINYLYRKLPVLDKFVSSQDSINLSKFQNLVGSEIWIDGASFANNNSYQNRNKTKAIVFDKYHNFYDFNLPEWITSKELSSAAFGGPKYKFYKIVLDRILLSVNLAMEIEDRELLKQKNKHISDYPDSIYFQYYLRAIPNTNDTISKYGYDRVPATESNFTELLIPINFNNPLTVLTDGQINNIADGFYKAEQKAWDAFSEEQKAYYEIATRAWGEDIAKIVCRGEVRLGFDEDMCHFAFMRTPYKTSNKRTPIGLAECQDFYMEGVKLYFQSKILIGIEWRGNSLFEPRHRY